LSEKDFQLERHRVIFEAMKKVHEKPAAIDFVSVDTMLKTMGRSDCNDDYYLQKLMEDVSFMTDADYLAREIKDFSFQRELIRFFKDGPAIVLDENNSIDDVKRLVNDRLFEILKQCEKKDPVFISECYDKILEDLRNKKPFNGLMTGFAELDGFSLGMRNGDMIVLAAPPSVGKTALAMNIATNIALFGKTVMFFNMEMKAEDLAIRQLCSKAIINSRFFKTISFDSFETEDLQKAINELYHLKFLIDDSRDIGIDEIRRKCQQQKCKRNGLDFVVIDYLQMVRTSEKAENRTVAIADVSRKIKLLAEYMDVPVLCLSQMNRSMFKDKQKPELHHLRESGSIEQDADQVWFITRKSEEDSDVNFFIRKNRNGKRGEFFLKYIGENFLFKNFDPYSVSGNSEYKVLL
jgi:replicative DNA helicase